MRHGVDSGLFQQTAHSPSYFELTRKGAGELVDFCIPCNPYFPTPEMFDELSKNLESMLKFYPSDSSQIADQLSKVLGLNPATLAMSNGCTELITWMDHLWIHDSVAIPIPTFGRWTDQPMETNKRVDMFLLQESDNFELDIDEYIKFIRTRGSRVAVICNPNNPDGGYLPRREIIRFMDELADLDLIVIDESFIDFVEVERNPSVAAEASIRPNVVVLKSLGKNFGLHGIRFGYLVANPGLAGKMRKTLPKWNLNSLAELPTNVAPTAHLAFVVNDIHAMYKQLTKSGVVFRNPPVAVTAGANKGGWACYFCDPDGATLELMQYSPGRMQEFAARASGTTDHLGVALEGGLPSSVTALTKTGPTTSGVGLTQRPLATPASSEVVIHVSAAGICGTDLHIAADEYPSAAPVTMGHELVGVVSAVGSASLERWLGKRVVCETFFSTCGTCSLCRAGRRNLCLSRQSIGSHVDGAFASHVVVPAGNLHSVPDSVSDATAVLAEPLAAVCQALLDPPLINPGDTVLVFGPGPMGLISAQLAQLSGAKVIVAGLERDRSRLDAAESFGLSTSTGPFDPESFDCVVECSGSPAAARHALDAVKRSGRYVGIGIFGNPFELSMDLILFKELTVTSGFATTPASWDRAMRLLANPGLRLAELVTDVVPLHAWETAFDRLREGTSLKTAIDPRMDQ